VRCPSGTANSSPTAGLTGNARSATGAQCRSRGPCRRAKARQRTADRGQCVSAWGGTRTPAPQRRRRSRPGTGARDGQRQCGHREARSPLACCSGHRWSGHQTGHRRSGRTVPKAHHPRLASGAREGAGSMVRPWAALLLTEHSGRIASGTTGARWCAGHTVKITTRRACVLVRDAPGPPAGPCQGQCQCPAAGLPLQSRKLPISKPRVAINVICRGVDVAMLYLWVRADLGGGRRARIGCHGSRSPRRTPRHPPAAGERLSHCRVTRMTSAWHWR
jgi:hypothetical protein